MGCFVLAFLVRLLWVSLIEISPVGDGTWYFRTALDLAEGRGYIAYDRAFPLDETNTDMFAGNPVPTAFWPVGYSAFLAGIFVLLGHVLPPLLLAKGSNIVLYLGLIWLTYRCSQRCFRSEYAARLTVLMLCFYPNHIAYTSLVTAEILFAFLLMLGTLLMVEDHQKRNDASLTVRIVLAGLVFGYATLTKPQAVVIPLILLALLYHSHISLMLKRTATLYAILLLVLAWWTHRNYQVFGAVFFVSNNSGINLLIGNNAAATGTYMWHDELTARVMAVEDEHERDVFARTMTLRYVSTYPWRTLALIPNKLFYLYASDIDGFGWNRIGSQSIQSDLVWTLLRASAEVIYVAVFVLFFVGLWRFRRRLTRYQLIGPALLVFFTLIYLPFFGASRYHFPLIPWLTIYAGAALAHLLAPTTPRS